MQQSFSSRPSSFSLPRPSPQDFIPYASVNPRRLVRLEPPPVLIRDYPALPCARPPPFVPSYEVTTHVLPAAFPRAPSDPWTPPPPHENASQKKERIRRSVDTFSALKVRQEQGRDPRPSRREVLWTVANRYVCTARRATPGLTLVMMHGIGAHKETWEPLIHRTIAALAARSSPLYVQEFWTLDAVQHGDSGLLNERNMGDTFDGADFARDVVNFILHYLPADADRPVPVNLPRICDSEAERRKVAGIPGRTLIGVGHSIGACAFVYPAVEYPALFSSLFFVESFTVPEYNKYLDTHRKNETVALAKRWRWNSKQEALNDLMRSAYYRSWDPRVIRAYVEFALITLPDGTVRTKSHPVLESLMLYERVVVYETWEMLDRIHTRTPMHWSWAGNSRAGSAAVQAQISWRRAQHSTNDVHPEFGHMLPQEAPDVVGADLARFLTATYEWPATTKL